MIFKNKKKILMLSLLLALVLLAIPYSIKVLTNDSSLIGEESYFTMRMINQYRENGLVNQDALTNEPLSYNLFYYLSGISTLNLIIAAKILPLIFGILTLLLFYLLLKSINLEADNILFSIIMLLMSPIFLYVFTVFTSDAFAILMLILAAYLFVKKSYFSVIPIVAAVLSSFVLGLAGILLMGAYVLSKRNLKNVFYVAASSVAIATILGVIFLGFNPLIDLVPQTVSVSNILIAFGALKGHSLIILVLAVLGMSVMWRRTLSQTLLYSVTIVVFLASLFYPELRILVTLVFAVLAGTAFSFLLSKKWNIKNLKWITLLLIVYIVIFSAAVFTISNIKQITPSKVDAVSYLSATDPDDVILSVERNGFLIEQLSNRKPYLDENSYKFKDYKEKIVISNSIYYSRNLNSLETILRNTNITHILIDETMISGEVWDSEDEGILFLLENSNSFVKLFENKEVKIFRYFDYN